MYMYKKVKFRYSKITPTLLPLLVIFVTPTLLPLLKSRYSPNSVEKTLTGHQPHFYNTPDSANPTYVQAEKSCPFCAEQYCFTNQ